MPIQLRRTSARPAARRPLSGLTVLFHAAVIVAAGAACASRGDEGAPASGARAPEVRLPPIVTDSAIAARSAVTADSALPTLVVYKTPTCGCCKLWLQDVADAGFRVEIRDTTDLVAVARAQNIPDSLLSCHTSEVGGYVVSGHVPADAIKKLLRDRPAIAGIGVAGMPAGVPGMPVVEGTEREPIPIMGFTKTGERSVFMTW
jgi:hypothetical protein